MAQIHVGDVGTAIRLQVIDRVSGPATPCDLSEASDIDMLFRTPGGVCRQKTGALVTDGTDGCIQYLTEAGVLDEAGFWEVQAHVTTADGSWWTETAGFRVSPNLCPLS